MSAGMFCRNSNHTATVTFSSWASEDGIYRAFILKMSFSQVSWWLLMWKHGAERPVVLLRRNAGGVHVSHVSEFNTVLLLFACFWWFRWPHVNRTLIFYCKNTTNTGNRRDVSGGEHNRFINPFMNHILHLGRGLAFCSFSDIMAFSLSLSWSNCAKWGLGWLESKISVWDSLWR